MAGKTLALIMAGVLLTSSGAYAQVGSVHLFHGQVTVAGELETVEIVFEHIQRTKLDVPQVYRVAFTDAGGQLIGALPLEVPPLDTSGKDTGRPRGFGFVEMAATVQGGILFVNGEPMGEVTPNRTGRYSWTIALLPSIENDNAKPFVTGVTLVTVGFDGTTRSTLRLANNWLAGTSYAAPAP